jgi:hypothetical protein
MPGHELTRGHVDDDGPGNTGIEVEVEGPGSWRW